MLQGKRISNSAFARRETRLKAKFKLVSNKVIAQNRKSAAQRAIKRLERPGSIEKPDGVPFLKNPIYPLKPVSRNNNINILLILKINKSEYIIENNVGNGFKKYT